MFKQNCDSVLQSYLNYAFITFKRRKRKSNMYAQSWTALFRAFSSHRQPSAIFSKVFPAFFFFFFVDFWKCVEFVGW